MFAARKILPPAEFVKASMPAFFEVHFFFNEQHIPYHMNHCQSNMLKAQLLHKQNQNYILWLC